MTNPNWKHSPKALAAKSKFEEEWAQRLLPLESDIEAAERALAEAEQAQMAWQEALAEQATLAQITQTTWDTADALDSRHPEASREACEVAAMADEAEQHVIALLTAWRDQASRAREKWEEVEPVANRTARLAKQAWTQTKQCAHVAQGALKRAVARDRKAAADKVAAVTAAQAREAAMGKTAQAWRKAASVAEEKAKSTRSKAAQAVMAAWKDEAMAAREQAEHSLAAARAQLAEAMERVEGLPRDAPMWEESLALHELQARTLEPIKEKAIRLAWEVQAKSLKAKGEDRAAWEELQTFK